MSTPETTSEDGNIGPTLWSVAVVGALLTLASPALFGVRGVVSSGMGAILAVANLWAIAKMVRGFLNASGKKLTWGPFGVVKLAALFLLLGIIVKNGYADVLPLAFGYLALPIGIVLAQLRTPSAAQGEH
jgi:hypothetical protein